MKQIDIGKYVYIEALKWGGFLLLFLIVMPNKLIETKYLLIAFIILVISSVFPLFIMVKKGNYYLAHHKLFHHGAGELKDVLDKKSFKKILTYLNEKILFPFFLIMFLFSSLFSELKGISWAKNALNSYFPSNNWFLLTVLILSGIVLVFSGSQIKGKKKENISRFDLIFILILALFAAYIILARTYQLGRVSYIITILSFLLICLVSFLILNDNGEDTSGSKLQTKL